MSDDKPLKTQITNEALWDFPMDYPIKIMGEAQHPLKEVVANILLKHVPSFDPSKMTARPSSSGKYISLTVTVYVEHKDQINGMYADFASCEYIKMVL